MIETQIRSMHPASLRMGEWAWLGRVDLVEQKDGKLRPCFRVVFADAVVDHWPIYESGYDYEFRNVDVKLEY